MPVKRGTPLDAAVVNPFVPRMKEEERKRMIEHYEQFLRGDRMDIWVKRQNTLKFLTVADRAMAEFHSALEKGVYPSELVGKIARVLAS